MKIPIRQVLNTLLSQLSKENVFH